VNQDENKYKSHVIADALVESIGMLMEPKLAQEVKTAVMDQLQKHRLISYARPDEIGLLNALGRTLVAISENPHTTQRALSIYLGVTEGAVQKCISQLVSAGLIAKTKVAGKNVLSINYSELKKLPDIMRFSTIFSASFEEDTPF
jgi:hypothetical protein